jgi:hypothetical protein
LREKGIEAFLVDLQGVVQKTILSLLSRLMREKQSHKSKEIASVRDRNINHPQAVIDLTAPDRSLNL